MAIDQEVVYTFHPAGGRSGPRENAARKSEALPKPTRTQSPPETKTTEVSKRTDPVAPALPTSHSIQPATHVIPYRIIGRPYRLIGQMYRDVILTGHPTDAELVTLAKYLHIRFPDTRFELFNYASQIANCRLNSAHYYDPPPRGCSDKWLREHDYGSVQEMTHSRDSGLRWEYVPGFAGTTLPGSVPLE